MLFNRFDEPAAIFRTEAEAEKVANFLNERRDGRRSEEAPFWVTDVTPSDEVIAAFARIQKTWRSADGELHLVANMDTNHLMNAAHLCLTWKDRFGVAMNEERRAMCQNVRDEIVRRKINEVGK